MSNNYLKDLDIAVTITSVGPQGEVGPAVPVIDNLTSTSTTNALSANQGKVLKDKFAPLEAIGGFYAPVSTNIYRVTSQTTVPSGGTVQMPLTKLFGTLSVVSDAITLPKGYLYEITIDLLTAVGYPASRFTAKALNASGANVMHRENRKLSASGADSDSGVIGFGIYDLTSSSTNNSLILSVDGTTGISYIDRYFGGMYIKQYKLIPFTA